MTVWQAVANFAAAGGLRATPIQHTTTVALPDNIMSAAIVNFTTFSDADFCFSFCWQVGTDFFDFTGMRLLMQVRRHVEDIETFISLTSDQGGGIDINNAGVTDDPLIYFQIEITRDKFVMMPEGNYVHSLIMERPDGLRNDIWRGTLTHSIGPTRTFDESGPP